MQAAQAAAAPAARTVPVGLLALGAAAVYQLTAALQPLEFLLQNVFLMDDAYYYLQVARNVADHGRVSFDGVHATSGIQPLWTILLSGLAVLFRERILFLRAVMVFSIGWNVLAGLQLRALGRRLHSAAAGEGALLLWSAFLLALSPTMIAMEYPLYVCTVLAALALAWRLWEAPRAARPRDALLLGLFLATLFWVRLDSAFFTVALAAAVSLRLRRAWSGAAWARRCAALLVPCALGAVLYVLACEAVAGTPLPISGLVKQHYAALHFAGRPAWLALAGHALWWVQVQCRPLLDLPLSVHTEALAWTHPANLAVLAAAALATAWGAVRSLRAGGAAERRAAGLLAVLLVLGALHALFVVATIGHFARVTQHYYGWSLVTWALWGGLLLAPAARPSRPVLPAAGGLFLLLASAGWRHFGSGAHTASLHLRRLPVIEWIRGNVPPEARIGAWNAGQLGYFCGRTVVNLDGLANDRAYLDLLRSGRPVMEYLQSERIEYLVDTDALDLTMPYGTTLEDPALFRGVLPLAAVEVVHRESDHRRAIVVLRVKDAAR